MKEKEMFWVIFLPIDGRRDNWFKKETVADLVEVAVIMDFLEETAGRENKDVVVAHRVKATKLSLVPTSLSPGLETSEWSLECVVFDVEQQAAAA